MLDSVEDGLGRLHQQLIQLDRELRQTRADYHRLVELSQHRVGTRLPRLHAVGRLSPQERRVAALAASGYSNLEVAAQLNVTVHTVKSQMCSILRKLDLRSRWELDQVLRGEEGQAAASTS